MNYRKLTSEEIQILEAQGCSATDWQTIWVKPDFNASRIENVRFVGEVQLGKFEGEIEIDRGITRRSGIYQTTLQNCTIGDNVYLAQVKNLVNYDVENQVVIENVGTLAVTGETTFGNGTEIAVLNEGGGRELRIYDSLSAQVAYLMVNYRHDATFIQQLEKIIQTNVATKKSRQGTIAAGARVLNCTQIYNVNIGASATIKGALHLEEGTIVSSPEAPTTVGEGVVAKHFIIHSGSKVDGGAILADCFVGQGVQIGKQYSAENSAFFANAEGFHGEACSVFAGPYTVTHHKSTLLIAGLFSFFNAGSGTNQSNHMYKLGPLHQGILERGSKTGSFSYLLWPCRVGAFTAVIGKHYANFDSSDFPFSYITEENGRSMLTPAMNLFTVGTRRDSAKWPARDRRKGKVKLDLLSFDLFSPYTMGRIVKGLEGMLQLYEKANKKQEVVPYKGIFIKRLLLKSCAKYYEIAMKIYLGQVLVKLLHEFPQEKSFADLRQKLQPQSETGKGDWVDIAGLLAPASSIQNVLADVRSGVIQSIEMLNQRLQEIHQNYDPFNRVWWAELVRQRLGQELGALSREQLGQLIEDWKTNAIKLNNMIAKDAEKEFDPLSRIGFGIDGDTTLRDLDFTAVRGAYESNKFVLELQKESGQIAERAEELKKYLENLA
jgi:hypothetical protein